MPRGDNWDALRRGNRRISGLHLTARLVQSAQAVPMLTALLSLLLTAATPPSLPDAPPPPPATAAINPFDEASLGRAVWERSPALAAARDDLSGLQAQRDRSYVLPNPGLALTWGTIPVGERNPTDLAFEKVPNYTASVSQLIEIGKRGPRQGASEAALRAARFRLTDAYQHELASLLEALNDQATAVVRISVLQLLVGDSAEILRLQRARASAGDVAALDVDRLEVEHLRLTSSLRQAEAARASAQAACAAVIGPFCPTFASEAEARRFLTVAVAPSAQDLQPARLAESRADAQALGATSVRAQEEGRLAARQKIPDPTVTLGYTHDQFVASGNQANSVTLSLSLPLPVFDRGQPEAARARRDAALAEETRGRIVQGAAQTATSLSAQLASLETQSKALETDALPRARDVAGRMEKAARRGGAALPDVLLARRALEELELDHIDVLAARQRAVVALRLTAGRLGEPPPHAP